MEYTYGLAASVWIYLGFAVAVFCVIVALARRHPTKRTIRFLRSNLRRSSVLSYTILFSFLTAVAWPAIFTLINLSLLLYRGAFSLKHELSSGVAALRVASIILAARAIFVAYKSFFPNSARELYSVAITPGLTNTPRAKVSSYRLGQFLAMQYFIYLFPVCLLWCCAIWNYSSLLSILLSWAIFFIIDDWNIIADYIVLLRGRVANLHFLRIFAFNALIMILGFRLGADLGAHLPDGIALKDMLLITGLFYAFIVAYSERKWRKLSLLPYASNAK